MKMATEKLTTWLKI